MPFALALAARSVVMIGMRCAERGGADFHFVLARDLAAGGVDDEMDFPVLDHVERVGPAFAELEELASRDAGGVQRGGGAAGGENLKPRSAKSRATAMTFGLSASFTLMKMLPARGKRPCAAICALA